MGGAVGMMVHGRPGAAAVNLDGHTNNNSVSAARGFAFEADGTVKYHDDYADGAQIDAVTDWIVPNDLASGDYEIRCTVNSGSLDSLSAGVWYTLDADRVFYDDTTGIFNYTIEIRIGSTTVATGTYIGAAP